jgi:hypothetical protein
MSFFERRAPKKMLTSMTIIEIETISTIPDIRTKGVILRGKRTQTFIAPLAPESRIVAIISVHTPSASTDISETFSLGIIETIKAISTLIEIISDTIFIFYPLNGLMRYVSNHLQKTLLEKWKMFLERNPCSLFLILIWRKLRIIDTVFLASQIRTKKTMCTIFAVITKLTIPTTRKFLRKITIVAAMRIDDLITVF